MDNRFGGPEFEHDKFVDDPAAQHELFPELNFPPHTLKERSESRDEMARTPNNPDLFFEHRPVSGLAIVTEVEDFGQYFDELANTIGINGFALAFDHDGALLWEKIDVDADDGLPSFIKRGQEQQVFKGNDLSNMQSIAKTVESTEYFKKMQHRLAA